MAGQVAHAHSVSDMNIQKLKLRQGHAILTWLGFHFTGLIFVLGLVQHGRSLQSLAL